MTRDAANLLHLSKVCNAAQQRVHAFDQVRALATGLLETPFVSQALAVQNLELRLKGQREAYIRGVMAGYNAGTSAAQTGGETSAAQAGGGTSAPRQPPAAGPSQATSANPPQTHPPSTSVPPQAGNTPSARKRANRNSKAPQAGAAGASARGKAPQT